MPISGNVDSMKSGLVNVPVEDVLKIRINCYDVLITLLEYDQDLLDVGEKVRFCLLLPLNSSSVYLVGSDWCYFLTLDQSIDKRYHF